MSDQARNPMGILLDTIEWVECDVPDMLHADDLYTTHSGVLHLGDAAIRVYQLNNGQRVLDADDVNRYFGFVATDPENPVGRTDSTEAE